MGTEEKVSCYVFASIILLMLIVVAVILANKNAYKKEFYQEITEIESVIAGHSVSENGVEKDKTQRFISRLLEFQDFVREIRNRENLESFAPVMIRGWRVPLDHDNGLIFRFWDDGPFAGPLCLGYIHGSTAPEVVSISELFALKSFSVEQIKRAIIAALKERGRRDEE